MDIIRKIKKLYSYVLAIGQHKDFTVLENKKIKLLNNYVILAVHFAILMPFADTISGVITINFILCYGFMLFCMFLILLLNKVKRYRLGCYLWLFNVIFTIFVFSIYLFPASYNEYYYVFMPGISLTLFPKNKKTLLFFILCFILFLTPYYIIPVYNKSIVDKIDIFAVFGIFTCIYLLFKYFNDSNIESEKKLMEAYQQLEETKKSELAYLQLKSLKAQMNPHFMFNAMNSIQSLILKGDKHEAYQYLSKFSNMIRENLNRSEKSFISFDEELSLLEKYLELEKLRFKENFEYHIIGEKLEEELKIPSMILQPFVENAIKHGLLHKNDGVKRLTISFVKTEVLECVIRDNGIGFAKSMEVNRKNASTHTSFSTQAIKQRLELLKDYYKTDIGIHYSSSSSGTNVLVKIPYLLD